MDPEYESAYKEYIRSLAEFRRLEEKRRGTRTTEKETREDWLSIMGYRQALERYEQAMKQYKKKVEQGVSGRRDAATMEAMAQMMGFEKDDEMFWKDTVRSVESMCQDTWMKYQSDPSNPKSEASKLLILAAAREADIVGIERGTSAIVNAIRDEISQLIDTGQLSETRDAGR